MKEKATTSAGAPAASFRADTNKTPRSQWVYDALRAAIQDGQYSRGDRLREEEVARSLGVSRTPVREALSRLQSKGFVEMAPGGLAVAQLSRSQVIELYSMREILEGSAARFAAQYASPSEIAGLRQIRGIFARTLDDPKTLPHINRELHTAIYEMAHNRYLLRTLEELQDAMTLLPNTTFMVKGRPKVALAEHTKIIDAIEKRDPDAAETAAREHIRKAQEVRLEMMIFDRD